MGGRQVKPDINFPEHQAKFRSVAQNCQAGPVQERSCKDVCCLVTFVLMTLTFIGVGMYFIVSIDSGDFERVKNAVGSDNSTSSSNKTSNTSSTVKHDFTLQNHNSHTLQNHQPASMSSGVTSTQFPDLLPALPYIIFMSIFSLILSLVIVIAISKIPKVMIYGIIGLTFLLIVGGIIGGLVLGLIELTLVCLIFGVVWSILMTVMLCCYKDQFDAAIVLLKVTGNFLRSKPSVLLAPLFVMFVSYFYFAFWLISFIGIQLDRSTESINAATSPNNPQYHFDFHDILSIFWLFLNFFYSYFLYYVMVFLIATATALWYFNIQGNYIIKGLKYIWNGHIGSLTFASMMVAIINMIKSSTDNQHNNQNACASCCILIVRCCLAFLEEILKVLNHNSIIVMSLTGEDFIDSAKSTIYLIYNNFGLFVAVQMVEFLLNVCVLFMTILLPTGLGLLLLSMTYTQAPSQQDVYLIISSIIILIICLLISMLTITVLSQALSCVFIFYCLDERFRNYNFGAVNRVPGDLRGLFNQIQCEEKNVNTDLFFRDSKQMN